MTCLHFSPNLIDKHAFLRKSVLIATSPACRGQTVTSPISGREVVMRSHYGVLAMVNIALGVVSRVLTRSSELN